MGPALAADISAAWHPSVGDHVRIVVLDDAACQEAPHFGEESGRTGRILRALPISQAPSHPFLVLLDRPHVSTSMLGRAVVITARHYAAHEMEPVAV